MFMMPMMPPQFPIPQIPVPGLATCSTSDAVLFEPAEPPKKKQRTEQRQSETVFCCEEKKKYHADNCTVGRPTHSTTGMRMRTSGN
jgi:hypothetical protein